MAQFTISLPEHKTQVTFNKSKFLKQFSTPSLIRNILEQTKDTDIEITQPFVTPQVLMILKHITEKNTIPDYDPDVNPSLILSGDYLGLDLLLVIGNPKFKSCPGNILRLDPHGAYKMAMYAITHDYRSLLEYILNRPTLAKSNIKWTSLMFQAVSENKPSLVNLLLKDSRVDPYYTKNLPLRTAVLKGYVEIVEMLLKDQRVREGSCEDHISPLCSAARNGHVEIVKRLLQVPQFATIPDIELARTKTRCFGKHDTPNRVYCAQHLMLCEMHSAIDVLLGSFVHAATPHISLI